MGTIHLADKFSQKVAERFNKKSVTSGVASKAYDWDGVESIKVYSIGTAPMGNYTRSGSSRYGTPAELNDSLQTMKMTQDKASTWTIDKGNEKEQYNIKNANRSLQRQLDEVVVPMEDKYTLSAWVAGAGSVVHAGTVNANTIIAEIGKMKLAMDNKLVPVNGRFIYMEYQYVNMITDSPSFIYTDKYANMQIATGEIGTIKNFRVIGVPEGYLPDGVYFLACTSEALLNPFKLREYKIHSDPPGINGSLVEMRVMYDAFVLDAKAGAVCAYANATNIAANATLTVNASAANPVIINFSGDKVIYTLDGSDPRCSAEAQTSTSNVTLNSAQCNGATYVKAIVYDADKAVQYSALMGEAFD